MNFARWYKAFRHSLGFGVHSPTAYRMVREVLNPDERYGYYAYDEIPALRKRCPTLLSDHDLQLIYRLAHELRPASVTIASPSPDILVRLMSKAAPKAKIMPSGGELLICEADTPTDLQNAVSATKTAVFTDSANPAAESIWQSWTEGHIYANPTRCVLHRRPDLPRQRFEISF